MRRDCIARASASAEDLAHFGRVERGPGQIGAGRATLYLVEDGAMRELALRSDAGAPEQIQSGVELTHATSVVAKAGAIIFK